MADSLVISPEQPGNHGLDYSYLKEEGIVLLQELAGKIWTDYNEHDPGVTTLEQLCYALTELSYRAEFPLKDLLAEPGSGKINPHKQALFIPRRILPCNPVTENDYRKLIVDRVPEVGNVWCRPWRSTDSTDFVNGLYELWLYAPGADPCNPQCAPEGIKERARRAYCHYRDLCEDLHSIRLLEAVPTIVFAEVSLQDLHSPETVLAELFFAIGNFLAPEIRRYPLQAVMDQGKTTSEIFSGPLLRNGFIKDDDLQPKATQIAVQDIVRIMTRCAGAIGVRNVLVQVGKDGSRYSGNDSIPVPEEDILQLLTRPTQMGFTIRLFKKGIECKPDPKRVERELNKLWSGYRRPYPLLLQYAEFFEVPRGRYLDLEQYYSIQEQFPSVYGIGSFGLPDDATEARRALARQFKGYLMVFEQLLADFFAQLAHAKDLYSLESGLKQTYFWQSLARYVPDVLPLLAPGYESCLQRIIAAEDPFIERRNRFLDFLLALYAEELRASSTLEAIFCNRPDANSGKSMIQAKLALLQQLVASTGRRGRGFDYLGPAAPRNICGMEIKVRIQLGVETALHRPLIDVLEQSGLDLVDSDAQTSLGRPLSRNAEYIEAFFSSVSTEQDEDMRKQPLPPGTFLRSQSVTAELLGAASQTTGFRAGVLQGDTGVTLVCKSPGENVWRLLGKYESEEAAASAATEFSRVLGDVAHACRQVYVVEHSLLRFAHGETSSVPQDFIYSFTITAVVSASPNEINTEGFRKLVHDVVRENTPAHIVTEYCFLRPADMCRFELLYWSWRTALREQEWPKIRRSSRLLQAFLQSHQTKGLGIRDGAKQPPPEHLE